MTGAELIRELEKKLGDNEDALLVVAALAAAWAETAAQLAIAEKKLSVAGGLASRGIAQSTTALNHLSEAARAGDAQAAELHTKIVARLSAGAQLASQADGVMVDVLQEYKAFGGNVSAVKSNAQGLIVAALNGVVPGAGAAIAGPLRKVLGI